MSGYLHPAYANSFSEIGTPYALRRCGGWLLKRQIPGYPYHDAMGCYPLFVCRDWTRLHEDLDIVKDEVVCLSLVTDPFGQFEKDYLYDVFEKGVRPFKRHFVVDLSCTPESFV